VLVESVTCGPGVGMQAEQLPSTEREHGVVKAPRLLVLVQDRPGAQQLAVQSRCLASARLAGSGSGPRWWRCARW
jgi:hypothetical protein